MRVKLPSHVKHGTINAYTNYGCRCEPCRKFAIQYQWEHRQQPCANGCGRMVWGDYRRPDVMCRTCTGISKRQNPEHGTKGRYRKPYLCRCSLCRAAAAADRRGRRQRAKEREWPTGEQQ